jgi:putative Mg2+ transporter-C (MgtC) family protein
MANTLLRPVARQINRKSLDNIAVSGTHAVYVIVPKIQLEAGRDVLLEKIEQAQYTLVGVASREFGQNEIEIAATIAADSGSIAELDQLVHRLKEHPVVEHAFWGACTDIPA